MGKVSETFARFQTMPGLITRCRFRCWRSSAKNGSDFIPLLEPMKAANTNIDLFFKIDRHPTAKGQQVAAAHLSEKLSPIVDEVWQRKHTGAATTRVAP